MDDRWVVEQLTSRLLCILKLARKEQAANASSPNLALMDEVNDELGISMNFNVKGDREHEAEQNIETIKEHIQMAYHCLPFNALPNILTQYLCMVSTEQLTYFPAKGSVSPYFIPYILMMGTDLDYENIAKFHSELLSS